jgi:hypothetical protein
MTDLQQLDPAIIAAFAVRPDASVTVKLRGFDVPHYGIEVDTFAGLMLTDPQLCLIAFGVHLEGAREATKEEIGEAKRSMGRELAAKLIVASTRNPAWADLVPNFTDREISRSVNNALLLTTGGDTAGFFADVAATLELMAKLATAQPSGPTATGKPAGSSSKGTP